MRGLQFATIHLPLAAGLNQKVDDRALQPPSLAIAKEIEFQEHGGLQTRYPFTTIGAFSDPVRKVVDNGDELLCFTKTELYSYDEGQNVWRLRGSHLAAKIEETPRFVATGDQINCDRAELGDSVFFAWEDAGTVYLSAIDRTTGAVLYGPASVSTSLRPKLVALATKVLLFVVNTSGGTNDLQVFAFNPATFAQSGPLLLLGGGSANLFYDACRVIGADRAVFATRRNPTTSYMVGTVDADLAWMTSTKARTCDGPIAVSCAPNGTQVQVARGNGTNVQGDLITISTLVDVFTNQAIGSSAPAPINQIAAAHRSVTDAGVYRCYVFWSHSESSGGTDWSSYSNWVSTGNTLGTSARFVRQLGIASRAFDYNGRVFVWGVFAGASQAIASLGVPAAGSQLQNTYFLYRDADANLGETPFLVAKAACGRAGGFAASTGHIPGVQQSIEDATTYAWAGTERRIIPLGADQKGYADRGPRDIAVTFDSNAARRCVRLGKTLYITGGEILQYDGVRVNEVGFHIYPWFFLALGLGGTGLAAGDYFYRSTWRWDNAAGEIDRSTTATTLEANLAAPSDISLVQMPLYISHKRANAPAVEWWRTPVNPAGDAPFYLVTKKDPTSTSNPNRYLALDPTVSQTATVEDSFDDAELTVGEAYPETGDELENLAPPPATIIAASADRIFLGGIAGDPDRIWYSKQRSIDHVASFNDALTVTVPHPGGELTALAMLNETLVAFRERAIYAIPGDGFDNVGGGANYGPARIISLDLGAVSQEAVAITPEGIIFKSAKGWHLLDRGWSVKYIGGPVADYDGDDVVGVHVNEARHQIRCATESRLLVFDYQAGQWAEWDEEPTSGTMWRGRYVISRSGAIAIEATAYGSNIGYGIDVETAWIKPADLQGFVRVTKLMILGEYRSACALRIRVAYDYNATYVDDKTWAVSPTTVGGPLQVKHGPSRQQCQAIKVRITAVEAVGSSSPPSSEAVKLTGLALELGVHPGLFRRLPAAQRQ